MSSVAIKQSLTASSATQKHPLGYIADIGSKKYIYVLLDQGAAAAAAFTGGGQLFCWLDRDGYEVTSDESASTANEPAGVSDAGAAFVDGEYGFIQYRGPCTCNKDATDDSYADGTGCIADTSSDGMIAKASNASQADADTEGWVGQAMAASDDTNDDVLVWLEIRGP